MASALCAAPALRVNSLRVQGARPRAARAAVVVRAAQDKVQVVQPVNGDPFIGMLETPVTSSPAIAWYLSNLPAYRTGVSPLLRGVEIGLAHGFLLVGPFIKLGPLRNVENVAEIVGCINGAATVLILTLCLAAYGAVTFQGEGPQVGVKTLSGRSIPRDPLQSAEGWNKFTAGFAVGGLSGAAWGYICTQILPYYS
jgi:photosystem I subunit 11